MAHSLEVLDVCLSLLSLTSAAAGENFYNEGCPKSLLCGVNFNDTECQLLAGNAYHMATMGQWLFYVLSRAVLLPPSGSFKLCSDLGQRTRSFEDMGDDDHDEGNHGPQMLSSDGEQDGQQRDPNDCEQDGQQSLLNDCDQDGQLRLFDDGDSQLLPDGPDCPFHALEYTAPVL